MTVDDVREIVQAAAVDPTHYRFDGARHEALCLLAVGQAGHVFLSERGQRQERTTFVIEDEACTQISKRLFHVWLFHVSLFAVT